MTTFSAKRAMGREIELAARLKALGDPVRLRILNHLPLTADCTYGSNVSQLAEALGTPQPTVSHHLKILREAGLVKNRKMCRDVYYRIDPKVAEEVVELLQLVFGPLPPPAGHGEGSGPGPCAEAGAAEGGG